MKTNISTVLHDRKESKMDFLIQTIKGKVTHDFSFTLLEAIQYQNWYNNNNDCLQNYSGDFTIFPDVKGISLMIEAFAENGVDNGSEEGKSQNKIRQSRFKEIIQSPMFKNISEPHTGPDG